MKLLIDENLPPRLAGLLTEAGHAAVHVRDLDAAGSSDPQIIDLALAAGRTIISADTDFGTLLASTDATSPSVILVREVVDRDAGVQWVSTVPICRCRSGSLDFVTVPV